MILPFNEEQKALIKKLNLSFDPFADLDNDQIADVDEAVGDYLLEHCLNQEKGIVNREGNICYDILNDIFANI